MIEAVMHGLRLQEDGVITWHGPWSCPISCDGKRTPMPCIGVSSTNPNEVEEIIGELKAANVGVDCEVLPTLLHFIPADQMRSE